jgi:hypothetical protein
LRKLLMVGAWLRCRRLLRLNLAYFALVPVLL